MMPEINAVKLADQFENQFGRVPRIFVGPGRINIIGEHVDYCGGLVMPAAIDRACYVACAPNGTQTLSVISDFGTAIVTLDQFHRRGDWRDYVAGMAFALRDAGYDVVGHDVIITSNVPIGAGVSSSAALEVALGLALTGGACRGPQLAQIAQRAENHYVGMACGIMDQFASANGVQDRALLLNCETLAFDVLPIDPRVCFLLVDSGVKHAHVEGSYAARRADCETAAQLLGVKLLSEIADLRALQPLTGNVKKRAQHVVSEIARTHQAHDAIKRGDMAAVGALMNQSHTSLSTKMEVSTPEVDQLATIAQATAHVYGARMMGGGFGGSVICLVDIDHVETARETIVSAYGAVLGRRPDAFVTKLAQGAHEVQRQHG
jgi:galactokinase